MGGCCRSGCQGGQAAGAALAAAAGAAAAMPHADAAVPPAEYRDCLTAVALCAGASRAASAYLHAAVAGDCDGRAAAGAHHFLHRSLPCLQHQADQLQSCQIRCLQQHVQPSHLHSGSMVVLQNNIGKNNLLFQTTAVSCFNELQCTGV